MSNSNISGKKVNSEYDDNKTEKARSSSKALGGNEEPEAPMPCTSSGGFTVERLSASESSLTGQTPNVEMTHLHKAEEKIEKYLELVDDFMIKNEKSSDEVQHGSGAEELMSCTSSAKFNSELSPFGLGATPKISIEMTYLHKKDEEKVDKYRYMTLDDDLKRRENEGRYETPCTSTAEVNERPAAQESHSSLETTSATDNKYDDVLIESENSSVPDASGYEDPNVVNSERPPVPGRSHSRRVTSTQGETSVYQELQ